MWDIFNAVVQNGNDLHLFLYLMACYGINSMSSDCWQSGLDHPFFLISLWTGTLALCWDFFSFFFSKGLYYSKNVHQIMKTGTPSKFNGHLFPQVWGPWCVKCLTAATAAYYIFHILTEGCFFSLFTLLRWGAVLKSSRSSLELWMSYCCCTGDRC